MFILQKNAALLIVDVQQGFDDQCWGVRNNKDAEDKIATLLRFWRETGRPVVHIKHMSVEPQSPLRPGQPGNDFKPAAKPWEGEHIEEKEVNSAFIGTELESYLRKNEIDTLIIVGLSTDHCVSTTTRMAGNLGFKTYVVADATATFNRTGFDGQVFSADHVHACALASLHGEFSTVLRSDELLNNCEAQLPRSSR